MSEKNNCIYANKSGLLALAEKIDSKTVKFIDDGSIHGIDDVNSKMFSDAELATLWIEGKLPNCPDCDTLLIGPEGPCENACLCPNPDCDMAMIG